MSPSESQSIDTAASGLPAFCFVLPVFDSYGVERGGALATVTERLARHLLDRGADVTVLTRDDGVCTYDTGTVRLLRYGSAHRPRQALGRAHALITHRLRRPLTSLNPYLRAVQRELDRLPNTTIAVFHNDPEAAAQSCQAGRRTVLWLHNFIEGPHGELLRTLPPTVELVAVSGPVAQWTAEKYDIARERIAVVPNGVDLTAFAPTRPLDAVTSPLRVITHGRIDPNKGTDTVARAVALARAQGVAVELHVVGQSEAFGAADPDFDQRLDAAVADAGATRTGWVPHDRIAALVAEADIGCYLPRSEEPFCLAALEAMASGCALIASSTGGLADLVAGAAVTVSADRPDKVAAAIVAFAGDPAALSAARRASRRRAEQYSWDHTVDALLDALAHRDGSDGRSSVQPHVVFVNNGHESFTPTVSGAIATCIWQCCQVAARAGQQPTVITVDIGMPRYRWPNTVAVRPRRIPSGRTYQALRALRRLSGWATVGQWSYARSVRRVLSVHQPDVIVCNNDPEIAVYLQDAFPDAVVVHWFHNLLTPSDRFRREYGRSRVRSVAVSAYLARAVELVYGLTPLSVATVLNGVDSQQFRPPASPADRKDINVTTITHLGRLAVEKGADTLLSAALVLAERRADFALELIGDTNWGRSEPTEFRGRVDALVAELRAKGIDVARPGHVARADVPAALRRADIFVIPSRWDEPFGLALLEGMATGSACIAASTGGLPEVLGTAGRMFARDDVGALATAIEELLDDPDLRRRLGAAARARAESMSWARTWAGLESVWTSTDADRDRLSR